MKISNRKDSAREDALDADGPDESGGEAKSPSSSQQDVPSVAKEAPIKSPEPTASVVTSTTTSQVPSGAASGSSSASAATSKPAKSHSSQSALMPSS